MAKESMTAAAGRLVSIDALRGFDMFWIIGGGDIVKGLIGLIANPMPGAIEKQFEHASWIGFYAWDLIMPLFLFIVGTSLPFAMSQRMIQQDGRRRIYLRILRRFVILFILGMCAQGRLLQGDLSRVHIYCNTLQAIACGYVVAAILILNVKVKWQGAACITLMAGYWALMYLVPFGGHPAGTLTPHHNLALYVDQIILGRFRDGTEYTWILSSMGFAATVLLGVMSGHILKSKLTQTEKFWALAASGAGCLIAGLVASMWFPIIKHIWSSSFILFAAGLSFLLLAAFYGVIDVVGMRKWAFFFIVIGTNAIFVYCFAELVNPIVGRFVAGIAEKYSIAVAAPIALSAFASLWLLLYVMWRKKIFIKV
ncbi:MAG: DUF5009 domain-containing protein [bacterium]